MLPNLVANDYKSHVVANRVVTFWLISTNDTTQKYFTLCLVNDSKFIEDYFAKCKDTYLQVTGHSSKNYMYSNFVMLWKLWRATILDASMSILLMTFFIHAKLSSLMHTKGK